MKVEQGRNHFAGTIWHSEQVRKFGIFLHDHRNAAVRSAIAAATIGAIAIAINRYEDQKAQIQSPRGEIETQYTPQQAQASIELQPMLTAADISLNMLLTSESIFDINGASFNQFAKDHGYDVHITPVYPVQRGEVVSEKGLKTRRIPWEHIADETTLMPQSFWLAWGQTENVFWQHEVTLTSKDGTRQERWAARFINLGGKQSMWVFNAIEFDVNGQKEVFIRPPRGIKVKLWRG